MVPALTGFGERCVGRGVLEGGVERGVYPPPALSPHPGGDSTRELHHWKALVELCLLSDLQDRRWTLVVVQACCNTMHAFGVLSRWRQAILRSLD
jgi:hypothetical protein